MDELEQLVAEFNEAESLQMTRIRRIYDLLKAADDAHKPAFLRMRGAGGLSIWSNGVFGPDGWRRCVAPIDRTITEFRRG
jgi:hypothetical protein